MKSIVAAMMMVCVVATNGFGTTYTSPTEYSAGFGDNSAHIAVDFDYGNSFVFEYHWDGEASGEDALQVLDAEGSLDVSHSDPYPGWGILIYDFAYPGGTKFDYGSSANTGWHYYLSDNGSNWESSGVGVSGRTLTNGGWDSWVWTNYDADWLPLRQPGEMPVPEPTTLTLLAFGAGMFVRKKA
jgi:hypothetical protein